MSTLRFTLRGQERAKNSKIVSICCVALNLLKDLKVRGMVPPRPLNPARLLSPPPQDVSGSVQAAPAPAGPRQGPGQACHTSQLLL